MKTQKRHFSIRAIYWIVQVAFGVYVAGAVIGVVVAGGIFFNLFGDSLHLNLNFPVAIDALETGKLTLGGHAFAVKFVDAYGKLKFIETPPAMARVFGGFLLIALATGFYVIKMFRDFVANVYRGAIFEIRNMMLLRNMAYGLLAAWIILTGYTLYVQMITGANLNFGSLRPSGNLQFFPGIIFVAIFVWMLSQIFLYGSRLQQDNDLTI